MTQQHQSSLLGFFSKKTTPSTPNPKAASAKTPKTPITNSITRSTASQLSLSSAGPSTRLESNLNSSTIMSSPLKRNGSTPQSKNKKSSKEWNWLTSPLDAELRAKTHPDYDNTTLHIPANDFSKLTAMEQQYWTIKKQMFNIILFFQKGKFYELYSNDADIAHSLFGMTIANRSSMMRMCGVPVYSFNQWAIKFTSQGLSIAKVDQQDTTAKLKNRVVSQVYTKSTLFELDSDVFGSLLMTIHQIDKWISICVFNIHSGHLQTTIIDNTAPPSFNLSNVKEVYLSSSVDSSIKTYITGSSSIIDIAYNNEYFTCHEALIHLMDISELNHLHVQLESNIKHHSTTLGLGESLVSDLISKSISACFSHLIFCNLFHKINRILSISLLDNQNNTQFTLDTTTINHLELFGNSKQEQQYSLFNYINHCVTPMGCRLLREWLIHPLMDVSAIKQRQLGVLDLNDNKLFSKYINTKIDIQRILMKCHANIATPSQFMSLVEMMEKWDLLELQSMQYRSTLISQYVDRLADTAVMVNKIHDIIDFEAASANNVFIPSTGFSAELDEINDKIDSLNDEMDEYINTLKFNAVYINNNQDYFIVEVTKNSKPNSNSEDNWVEYSKTAKVVRYTNEYTSSKSSEMKTLLTNKQQCLLNVQGLIFNELLEYNKEILLWSEFISVLDCLNSFNITRNSMKLNCTPSFRDQSQEVSLEIKECTHPVLNDFIPNDVIMRNNMFILTGPNMGGKSTLLRQVAITVIMAQIGMNTSSREYSGIIVDQIYTRVGARDDMAIGQSTFMVELMETSRILNNATSNSLIIMDEFGRGTSSIDGYALAYAVCRHLQKINCITMFATHFKMGIDGMKMYMDYRLEPEIMFLYKLVDGECPRSCGFEVARLAKIPEKLIKRAEEIANEYNGNK
eukprot:NODE_341_length_10628_cov_0.466996.p1 type:complete len:910 gc:universal NODE_341_length_10628_cov_0.466996:4955-2226(-)